jgi:hypothetical protein
MRALRRGLLVVSLCAGGAVTSSCVVAPSLDELPRGPTIKEIIARVKCDLVDAVKERLTGGQYPWFQTWTAQVSLNFIVNDQTSLTPGVTFIQPLTQASIPLRVVNGARSWNLGAGAGITTTATRNETITFSVSLKEISDDLEFHRGVYSRCPQGSSIGLNSALGLTDWISDAFSAVDAGDLTSGHHKSPKTAGGVPGGGKPGGANNMAVALIKETPLETRSGLSTPIKDALTRVYADLKKIGRYEIVDPVKAPDPTLDLTSKDRVPGCSDQMYPPTAKPGSKTTPTPGSETTPKPGSETILNPDLKMSGPHSDTEKSGVQQPPSTIIAYVDKTFLAPLIECTLKDTRTLIEQIRYEVKAAGRRMNISENQALQWAHAVEDYLLPLELDAPLDVISNQIQFIIVYNASVSPSWTLLHFKGPTTGSSFLSGTKTLTHTLNISIGPPTSPDQVNSLNALQIGTAVGNALKLGQPLP